MVWHLRCVTPLYYNISYIMVAQTSLENYFAAFRENIIGINQSFESPFGTKQIIYADWTASGRAYKSIEDHIQKEILPFVANTHTEATVTGTFMSKAYEEAKHIIKQHVGATNDDILLFCGSGMTAAVNKLQRILGLKIPERLKDYLKKDYKKDIDELLKPVVFITHMEHHSNHISWLETIADVEIINAAEDGNVSLEYLKYLLQLYKHRKNKIAAVTACSNVTGIQTPYHEIAKLIHQYNGSCFVDFACSAPYVQINMHPSEKDAYLDAIYFSPHKFLGGPGTPGILIFNRNIYKNKIPDHPGGGTVIYSNPWKVHEYITDIEQKEDGGTPPFLGAIKAAMCICLKEKIGVENILMREKEILQIVFNRFSKIDNIDALEMNYKQRLGIVSFIVHNAHYNLIVKILNDRFGIQTRGGCSCAGTYGHELLHVDKAKSYTILKAIRSSNLLCKPGWIRLSVHPCMSNAEINFIMDAIESTAAHFNEWKKDYVYNDRTNEYCFKGFDLTQNTIVYDWLA